MLTIKPVQTVVFEHSEKVFDPFFGRARPRGLYLVKLRKTVVVSILATDRITGPFRHVTGMYKVNRDFSTGSVASRKKVLISS